MLKVVDGKDYIEQIRDLITEYSASLGRDLSFQNLEEELIDPAAKYTAPEGEIVVAVDKENNVVGMVAYHRHSEDRCEMKRLYIKPEGRGKGLSEVLAQIIIQKATEAGFKEMVLDTLTSMQPAIRVYTKFGFQECSPYYDNPMPDVVYMKKDLL